MKAEVGAGKTRSAATSNRELAKKNNTPALAKRFNRLGQPGVGLDRRGDGKR